MSKISHGYHHVANGGLTVAVHNDDGCVYATVRTDYCGFRSEHHFDIPMNGTVNALRMVADIFSKAADVMEKEYEQ